MIHEPAKSNERSARCPFCGGPADFFLSSSDANRKTTTDIFKYYKCFQCDLVFLDPIPDDLAPFYRGGYNSIPSSLEELRAIANHEAYRIETVLRHKKAGSLLEIGPWMGIFSCNAKDAGFDVTVIEMNETCVDFLNDVVSVNAIQSADPCAVMTTMAERFDVIALWHSLEHLIDPWAVLQCAAERLAPGGILLVAVPDIESYDFSVLKEKWTHVDAPRHLYFYTARSLERVCLESGLTLVEYTTSDRLSEILSIIAWSNWANNFLPVKYIRHLLGVCAFWIARYRSKGNGSGLTAIFTKPHQIPSK